MRNLAQVLKEEKELRVQQKSIDKVLKGIDYSQVQVLVKEPNNKYWE